MVQLDQNDLDLLTSSPEEDEKIKAPEDLSEEEKGLYDSLNTGAKVDEPQYLLFTRDDTKDPILPITVDFLCKVVSINTEGEDNIIIEMAEYASVVNEKNKVKVGIYVLEKDKATGEEKLLTDDVVEDPKLRKKVIDKWVHYAFTYDPANHTWTAFYDGEKWFTKSEDPRFVPEHINFIKVYTKIPYAKGGDYEAYIANLSITGKVKFTKTFPPSEGWKPKDRHPPRLIGGTIIIRSHTWWDHRYILIGDVYTILWWPVRSPLNLWEWHYSTGLPHAILFDIIEGASVYIGYYYHLPPIYLGYWRWTPAIGPIHRLYLGTVYFRNRRYLHPVSVPITIESWTYINIHSDYPGGWFDVWHIETLSHGFIVQFDGLKFRVSYGSNVYEFSPGSYIDKWVHFAISYDYSNRRLLFYINGDLVYTFVNFIFVVVGWHLRTGYLGRWYTIYHTGVRIINYFKYVRSFNIISVSIPPYLYHPLICRYPILEEPSSLNQSSQRSTIFRYPIDENDVTMFETNGTYYMENENVKLLKSIEDDDTVYTKPIVLTEDPSNEITDIDFYTTGKYKLPLSYTLEFWIYPVEPYEELTDDNIEELYNYTYSNLLIGNNGIYFISHVKNTTNTVKAIVDIEDMDQKWNHIAVTYDHINKTLKIYVNGKRKILLEDNNIMFINTCQELYFTLMKSDFADRLNKVTQLTLVNYIKYTTDFDYTKIENKPYE